MKEVTPPETYVIVWFQSNRMARPAPLVAYRWADAVEAEHTAHLKQSMDAAMSPELQTRYWTTPQGWLPSGLRLAERGEAFDD